MQPLSAFWRAVTVLTICALAHTGSLFAESPQTLRIGFQKSSVALQIVRKIGALDKRLTGTTVIWIEFPSGPPMLEALGATSIDLAVTGDSPPIFAQAAKSPIVYVGVEAPKPDSSAILVKADSSINELVQLKGKRVAFQKGSSAHFLVLSALAKAQLGYTEITPLYLSPADARAAFSRGDIDAWAIWDPYLASAEHSMPHRVLSSGRGLSDDNNFYLSTRVFATQYPQVIMDFLAALGSAQQYRASHPEETRVIVIAATGLDSSVAEAFLSRYPNAIVAPLTAAVIHDQQRIADAFLSAGLIPRPIVVADAVWQNVRVSP